ncbi:MAG: PLDc N-terminal domain-containing protein [Phycisphaerae bacterium]|nr:PLDc N-terminal domain-containing protein [Phycisphaerae bacterium]
MDTLYTILAHLAVVAGFLLAVVFAAHILRQKRSPSGTIAWLLVIVFIPYVGVPLYLMFGGRKLMRQARRKGFIGLRPLDSIPLEAATTLDKILRTYGVPGATSGNRMTFCPDGIAGYKGLVDLIETAQRSIHIAIFVFTLDEVGRDIFERLIRRATDGLDVRLMIDDLGSLHTPNRKLKKLVKAGGKVAHFMPVVHIPFRGMTNLRNHRKIVVVDEQKVMTGGTNIAKEYIGPTEFEGRWLDMSFILEGPEVELYSTVFRSDWKFATGEDMEVPAAEDQAIGQCDGGGAVLQLVPSGPDMRGDMLYDAVLSSVFAAQKRIWIVTPYFVPNDTLYESLLLACRRGVDVRILVPHRSNHALTNMVRGSYLRGLQKAGATIYQHPKMVHAKVMIFDETATLGSSNFDVRSLFLDYEVSMFIYSQGEVARTEQWVKDLSKACTQGVKNVSAARDLCEGAARLLAPLL